MRWVALIITVVIFSNLANFLMKLNGVSESAAFWTTLIFCFVIGWFWPSTERWNDFWNRQ